ncbi:hypothetical protein COCVIDRAFT_21062 [Bipolaris victoriae FI3]|uniref:HTH CENPB-type domain-containing protein n=1 Tax=Bipolaris victoriae (strain FI3) TaxID=930091 RepID=W7E4K1_BIPV3|nr:hypothetical protein COCVIDRAFT_21062 [Bipolaris victoriae FI3]
MELIRHFKSLAKRGLPPTREATQNSASQIAKEEVGEGWVTRFLARNNNHVISQWTVGMDSNTPRNLAIITVVAEALYFLPAPLARSQGRVQTLDAYYAEARHPFPQPSRAIALVKSRESAPKLEEIMVKSEIRCGFDTGLDLAEPINME